MKFVCCSQPKKPQPKLAICLNNKGASTCSVWISSRNALEEIYTYTRRGYWSQFYNTLLDSTNTRLVVKNYPVVLGPIRVWQNICSCLPLGNRVVNLFFNHLPKHKRKQVAFQLYFKEQLHVFEKDEEKSVLGRLKWSCCRLMSRIPHLLALREASLYS